MKKKRAAIKTERKQPALCPYCGATLSAVTGVAIDTYRAPKIQAGDYSVCAYCFEVLRFDGRFYTRTTAEEAAKIYRENQFLRDMRAKFRDRKNPRSAIQ